ncbi:MAG: hypothetical protein ACHQHO_03115 [Solirubrobacterales bacterium]
MRSSLYLAALLVAAFGLADALPASASSRPGEVAVQVQPKPSITDSVRVSFRPRTPLPAGGYYYAVIVLKPYKHYTSMAPPPCAVSSDMKKTAYGYPHAGRAVSLVLTRTGSRRHVWCRGGSYAGAIYAVPSPPPCEAHYPCPAEEGQGSSCFNTESGHPVCGVARRRTPRYTYPAGLPVPVKSATRIVGYFRVTF